ncbi:MAG: TolC family protein [Candidatus Omnitrophota bacterium]
MRKNSFILTLVSLFCLSLFSQLCLAEEEDQASTQETIGVYFLSLDEVSRLALENNFDIQLAKFDARIKGTDLEKEQSIFDTVIDAEIKYKDDQLKRTSSLIGTKSLTNEYNFGATKKTSTGTTLTVDLDNERSWTDSSFATINPAHESKVTLGITQELGKNFFGLNDRGTIKITKIDIENAEYTSLDKIELNLANAQKAYFRIALALKSLQIKHEILQKAQDLFNLHSEKIKDGLTEMPELLAAQANVRQREADVLIAENELEFSMNYLKFILNLNEDYPEILPEDEFSIDAENTDLEKVLKDAFINRRDYTIAKNEVKAKNINLEMKDNNLWPEINLEASLARNGIESNFSKALSDAGSEDNPEYYVGIRLSFPIENRLAKSQYNRAELEKAKAIVDMKRIERFILTVLIDAVRNCNIYRKRANIQIDIAAIQENKLKEEEKRFKYGRSNTDTIIRFQEDLLNAKLLAAQAAYDYHVSLIELSLSENTLLDKYSEDIL